MTCRYLITLLDMYSYAIEIPNHHEYVLERHPANTRLYLWCTPEWTLVAPLKQAGGSLCGWACWAFYWPIFLMPRTCIKITRCNEKTWRINLSLASAIHTHPYLTHVREHKRQTGPQTSSSLHICRYTNTFLKNQRLENVFITVTECLQ